jgi:type II secretory pathway pseudopilin PulG
MLVVISILGILAALLVPALKNFGHADAVTAATRQILDDVGRTRQLAISHHTTVYMVFVPANFWGSNPSAFLSSLTPAQQVAATNLCDKQLTGYTFVSLRTVGDQPGQGKPHYLAPWHTLPDGTFIVHQKFESALFDAPQWKTDYKPSSNVTNFVAMNIPFPTEDSPSLPMPCIAFNYLGQLTTNGVDAVTSHEYIPLARGSVSPAWDPATKVYQLSQPDISEVPPGNSVNAYNIIDIEPLTGRATLQQPKMK